MHRPFGSASLVEFAYVSEADPGLPRAALLRLADQAMRFNLEAGITGFLSLADGQFRQVIEGPCDVVLLLASRILTDRRHGAITVTGFRPIEARRFSDWSTSGFTTVSEGDGPSPAWPVGGRFLAAVAAPAAIGARVASRPR